MKVVAKLSQVVVEIFGVNQLVPEGLVLLLKLLLLLHLGTISCLLILQIFVVLLLEILDFLITIFKL